MIINEESHILILEVKAVPDNRPTLSDRQVHMSFARLPLPTILLFMYNIRILGLPHVMGCGTLLQ